MLSATFAWLTSGVCGCLEKADRTDAVYAIFVKVTSAEAPHTHSRVERKMKRRDVEREVDAKGLTLTILNENHNGGRVC